MGRQTLNRATGLSQLVRGRAVRVGARWFASLTDGTVAEVVIFGPHRRGGFACGVIAQHEPHTQEHVDALDDMNGAGAGEPRDVQVGYNGEPAF